jgi:hypothetical protein
MEDATLAFVAANPGIATEAALAGTIQREPPKMVAISNGVRIELTSLSWRAEVYAERAETAGLFCRDG